MEIELLLITNNAEELIEKSARVCYNSKLNKSKRKVFLQSLIKKGHHSILEHATATFKISGISRALSHQLVRHRLASYSQQSQRYVDMNNFDYIIPPKIENDYKLFNDYENLMEQTRQLYSKMIKAGIKKEDARFILPNATKTELIMTANFREWRHIIELRCSKKAQWEIREVFKKILIMLYDESPIVFEDLYKIYIRRVTYNPCIGNLIFDNGNIRFIM